VLSCWFLGWLILRFWTCRRHVPPKRRFSFNGPHGVMARKTELFITTAVRTSNPTNYLRYFVRNFGYIVRMLKPGSVRTVSVQWKGEYRAMYICMSAADVLICSLLFAWLQRAVISGCALRSSVTWMPACKRIVRPSCTLNQPVTSQWQLYL
jgi:hypothetical protein